MSLAPLTRFPDADALGYAAALRFLDLGRKAIAANGRFTVALSGGRGPLSMYAALQAQPKTLPWTKVGIYWVDERWVPFDHPDSNYGTAKRLFLEPLDALGAAKPFNTALATPQATAEAYAQILQADFGHGTPAFDLCLLGMGPDGHTASLFPGSPALDVKDQLCTTAQFPGNGQDRVTLTFPVLNASHAVLFLVQGEDKEALVGQMHSGKKPDLPAARVKAKGGVNWFFAG